MLQFMGHNLVTEQQLIWKGLDIKVGNFDFLCKFFIFKNAIHKYQFYIFIFTFLPLFQRGLRWELDI